MSYGAVTTVLVAGAVVLLLLMSLKNKVLDSIPVGLKFVPTSLEDYPQADRAAFEAFSQTLLRLGFIKLLEYRLEAESGTIHPSVARVFCHPQHACFAEINQAFPAPQIQTQFRKVGCNLATMLSQGYSFASTDRQPEAAIAMLRMPTSLWVTRPGLGLEELFQKHIADADRLADKLDLAILRGVSFEEYFTREQARAVERKELFRDKNIGTALYELTHYSNKPLQQWLGPLQGQLDLLSDGA